MFFVPVAILVIEDEDDRTFMENLYSSYHRLMYHTIHLITEDPWITEDILQSTTEKLIQNLDTIKQLPTHISARETWMQLLLFLV